MTDARRPTLQERFEAKFVPEPNSGCWLWVGALTRANYGCMRADGRTVYASHVAYELYVAPITNHLHVLHHCDTPYCVNPDHLFLGTELDNARDKQRKGRGNQPSGHRSGGYIGRDKRRGEGNGSAKLTASDVVAIRASGLASRKIASLYGVTKTLILQIRSRQIWTHI